MQCLKRVASTVVPIPTQLIENTTSTSPMIIVIKSLGFVRHVKPKDQSLSSLFLITRGRSTRTIPATQSSDDPTSRSQSSVKDSYESVAWGFTSVFLCQKDNLSNVVCMNPMISGGSWKPLSVVTSLSKDISEAQYDERTQLMCLTHKPALIIDTTSRSDLASKGKTLHCADTCMKEAPRRLSTNIDSEVMTNGVLIMLTAKDREKFDVGNSPIAAYDYRRTLCSTLVKSHVKKRLENLTDTDAAEEYDCEWEVLLELLDDNQRGNGKQNQWKQLQKNIMYKKKIKSKAEFKTCGANEELRSILEARAVVSTEDPADLVSKGTSRGGYNITMRERKWKPLENLMSAWSTKRLVEENARQSSVADDYSVGRH